MNILTERKGCIIFNVFLMPQHVSLLLKTKSIKAQEPSNVKNVKKKQIKQKV
jgi:hypothetical protein